MKNPFKNRLRSRFADACARLAAPRTVIVERHGSLTRISFPFWSIIIMTLALGAAAWWIAKVSHVYTSFDEIIAAKNDEIDRANDKLKQNAEAAKAYRDTIQNINVKIDRQYREVIDLLSKNDNLDRNRREQLLRDKMLLSAELQFAGDSLAEYTEAGSGTGSAGGADLSKLAIENKIIVNENIQLRRRNTRLENAIIDMRDYQSNLIDKIVALSDGQIGTLETLLGRINTILGQIGLRDRQKLINRAKGEKQDGLGGQFVPVAMPTLDDENLRKEFAEAAARINTWEGLSRAAEMLPIGTPVRGGRITSPFGTRTDPFLGVPAMHTGIDFSGKTGTPFYSTGRGRVIYSGNRGDYGLTVEVYHGMGFTSIYAHLSEIHVKKGDLIEKDVVIGLAGSTGRSTADHLHYELRFEGRPINPYSFITAAKAN